MGIFVQRGVTFCNMFGDEVDRIYNPLKLKEWIPEIYSQLGLDLI